MPDTLEFDRLKTDSDSLGQTELAKAGTTGLTPAAPNVASHSSVAQDALGLEALGPTAVVRRAGLTPTEFRHSHVDTGTPVVLPDLTAEWPARRWSVGYLKSVAGEREVPVYDSRPARDRQHQHAAADTLPLSDFLTRLENGEKDLRMFFYNLLAHAPELAADVHWPEIGLQLFRRLPVLFVGGRGARVQMHFDIDLADNLLCHFGGKNGCSCSLPRRLVSCIGCPIRFRVCSMSISQRLIWNDSRRSQG